MTSKNNMTSAPAAALTLSPGNLTLFLGPAATAVAAVEDNISAAEKTISLPAQSLPCFPFFAKNLSVYKV